jgi:hypothetical protein
MLKIYAQVLIKKRFELKRATVFFMAEATGIVSLWLAKIKHENSLDEFLKITYSGLRVYEVQ